MIGNGQSNEFLTDVARGVYPDKEPFGAFGKKKDALTGSGVIWPNGTFEIPPATGYQMEIVSTSTEDSAAGTGIRTMEMHYLDVDLEPQAIEVALDGTNIVQISTPKNIRFVQCLHLLTAGTLRSAVGNISVTETGVPAQPYSYISIGDNRCSSSARMVPAGKRCLVYGAIGGASSGTAGARAIIELTSSQIETHDSLNPLILFPFGSSFIVNLHRS